MKRKLDSREIRLVGKFYISFFNLESMLCSYSRLKKFKSRTVFGVALKKKKKKAKKKLAREKSQKAKKYESCGKKVNEMNDAALTLAV